MEERKYRAKHGRQAFVDSRREQAAKYFARNGLSVIPRTAYVLDRHASWPSNLILERVAQFVGLAIRTRKTENKHFALHTFVHHGVSSQALL